MHPSFLVPPTAGSDPSASSAQGQVLSGDKDGAKSRTCISNKKACLHTLGSSQKPRTPASWNARIRQLGSLRDPHHQTSQVCGRGLPARLRPLLPRHSNLSGQLLGLPVPVQPLPQLQWKTARDGLGAHRGQGQDTLSLGVGSASPINREKQQCPRQALCARGC